MARMRPILFLMLLVAAPLHALSLNGFTRFGDEIPINAGVSGVVQRVAVQPGQRVSRGDLLLQLDDRPHRARLAQVRARAERLKPPMQTAELELERAQELYDRDSLSTVALQMAESRFAEARGAYEAALAEQKLAEYELELTRIRSPASGRVLTLTARPGQFVNPQADLSPLLLLVRTRSMQAVATLGSEQWNPELIGRKARVSYRGKTFEGRVEYLGLKRVKTGSGLSGYPVHIRFETDALIPADMPVGIEIEE